MRTYFKTPINYFKWFNDSHVSQHIRHCLFDFLIPHRWFKYSSLVVIVVQHSAHDCMTIADVIR